MDKLTSIFQCVRQFFTFPGTCDTYDAKIIFIFKKDLREQKWWVTLAGRQWPSIQSLILSLINWTVLSLPTQQFDEVWLKCPVSELWASVSQFCSQMSPSWKHSCLEGLGPFSSWCCYSCRVFSQGLSSKLLAHQGDYYQYSNIHLVRVIFENSQTEYCYIGSKKQRITTVWWNCIANFLCEISLNIIKK